MCVPDESFRVCSLDGVPLEVQYWLVDGLSHSCILSVLNM